MRRAVQQKFGQLKIKPPRSYSRFLSRNDIEPGAGTKRELELDVRARRVFELPNDGDSTESEEDQAESDDEEKTKASKGTTPTKPKAVVQEKQKQEVAILPSNISFSPIRPTTTMSSPGKIKADSMDINEKVEILQSFKQDGSEENPYIIIVDLQRPESNWGFEVSEVDGIEHRDYKRDIFHIRKVITLGQEELWSASIPIEKYPGLAKRSVLLSGPSQDFWHASHERYHQVDFCEDTKTVHETLETDIEGDLKRKVSYWLLVFPEGTQLENHILSDDAVHVRKEVNEMVDDVVFEEGTEEEETVEILGTDIYWRIAKSGGTRIRKTGQRTTRKRYAQRKQPAKEKTGKGKNNK